MRILPFVLGLAAALPLRAENLLDIYRQAELKDTHFQKVQVSRQAVSEASAQADAKALLPSIQLNANVDGVFQNIDLGKNAIGQSGNNDFMNGGYTLKLTQPIYHPDRYVALTQAGLRVEQADIEIALARQELMLRVAERYFAVLMAQDDIEFVLAQKKAMGQQLEQIQQRFAAGDIAITDVPEAQAGYDRVLADEIEAVNRLDDAREALREVTAEDYASLAALARDIPLVRPDPENENRWIERALEQNPRIAAAARAVEIAQEEIKRQTAGHLPSLDLVGNHGYLTAGGRFGSADVQTNSIGLSLTIPIYEGGQVSSRTREAAYRHQEALVALEQEQRAVRRGARDAYLGVLANISRIQALKQILRSNEAAVEAIGAGLEVGTRTTLDLVLAERELYRARRDHTRARYEYLLNSLRLKRAAGLLSIDDIAHLNTWLKPR